MSLNLKILLKQKRTKLTLSFLCLFVLASVAFAVDTPTVLSLETLFETNSLKRKPSQELLSAETSLRKTQVGYYPDLSGSLRVNKPSERSLHANSSYSFTWNTPIGVNFQAKYIPEPSLQENEFSLSVSSRVLPLPIYSWGLVTLNDTKSNLEDARASEIEKIFNEELALYQNYRKAQIQYEKLLLTQDELESRTEELDLARANYDLGTGSLRDVEEKNLQYRSSYYQYQAAELNFKRQMQDLTESLGLSGEFLPERLPTNTPQYPSFTWDIANDIEAAKENSLDLQKAKKALIAAKRELDESKLSFIDAQLGFNYNIKTLDPTNSQTPSWSINLNMSTSTKDVFFNFTKEEKEDKYNQAEENYMQTLKQLEKKVFRMKEDWELSLYQTQTKELSYLRALNELEAKKKQFEAGLIKEIEYHNSIKSSFESLLDFWDTMVSFEIATNNAMFCVGRTDKVVIFN